jgi:hypothetical protein
VTHFENTEGREDSGDGEACFGNEPVDGSGVGTDGCEDLLFEVVKLEFGRVTNFGPVFFWSRVGQGPQVFKDVVDRFDEGRTVSEEAMAPLGGPVVDPAGNGEDLAVLLRSESGGYERSTASAGFNDDGSQGEAADDAVSLGEASCSRSGKRGRFTEQGSLLEDFVGKRVVLGRVDIEDPTAENGQGPAAGSEGAAVS